MRVITFHCDNCGDAFESGSQLKQLALLEQDEEGNMTGDTQIIGHVCDKCQNTLYRGMDKRPPVEF